MFKKYIALLILSVGCAAFAQGTNSILSTSVRKTAENKLNLTFYTKGENVEKPIVKDKGANQYVILLPNHTNSAGHIPDFKNASDIVSDVNVKTINEGAVTYTKVSITTKKPVTINAETRKTSQSAADLTGVNDIISKVNLISQDIQSSKSIQPAAPVQAAAPAMPKLNSVQDILNNKNSIGTVKPAVDVKKETPAAMTAPVKSVSAHVPANTSAIKADSKKLKNENIKNVRLEAVKNIDKLENNIKSSVKNNVTVNDEEPETIMPPVNEEAPVIEEVIPQHGFNASKILASPMLLITILLLGIAFLVMSLLSKMKSALEQSSEIDKSFVERMNASVAVEKNDLAHIAENKELNWQEKYNSLKEDENEKQLEQLNSYAGIEPDEDLDVVEESVEELPQIVEAPNPFANVVSNSGDMISGSMKRSLKAFDEEITLAQTRRNTGLKNRFKGFETNPGANIQRNMSELLDTVIKMEEERPVPVTQSAPAVIEKENED